MRLMKRVLMTGLLSVSAAALAQQAAPAAGPEGAPPPMMQERDGMKKPDGGNQMIMGLRVRDLLTKLSPEGRQIMVSTLQGQREQMKANGDKLREVRERILTLIGADRFDAAALKRVFAEERQLTADAQMKRHDAMVAALTRLSSADRNVVAISIGEMRDRKDKRIARLKDHLGRPGMAEPTPGN